MTKQELLTKLATECATWHEVFPVVRSVISQDRILFKAEGDGVISHREWLAEREQLLKKRP